MMDMVDRGSKYSLRVIQQQSLCPLIEFLTASELIRRHFEDLQTLNRRLQTTYMELLENDSHFRLVSGCKGNPQCMQQRLYIAFLEMS